MPNDSTRRFSNRVEAYQRYRPRYPTALLDHLEAVCSLAPTAVIADVGAGTGILSLAWLERGYRVVAVEPNRSMRVAAEQILEGFDRFVSTPGTAERTGLPSASIDLVCAAQAFHWFDRQAARREFRRMLKTNGRVAIVWNDRRKASTPFLVGYEQLLLDYGTDYTEVDHVRVRPADLDAFFGPRGYSEARFDNHQVLDFTGLAGRLESSSYTPAVGSAAHARMIADARVLFETHATDGTVRIEYDTRLYHGPLS